MRAQMRSEGIPGLSVAIVRDQTLTYARGFGYADVETGTAASATTAYSIASLSKPLSAVVILRLVELGRLDLERPMASFAGYAEFCTRLRESGLIFGADYDCEARQTVRHLLTHTGNGIPGTRFLYNPYAFSWLSRVVDQVTDEGFEQLFADIIFAPLGMQHSSRGYKADQALALPYQRDEAGQLRRSPLPQLGQGAGAGVFSTVEDLARFDMALDRHEILSETTAAAMFSPTRALDGSMLPYGYGCYVQDYQARRLLWHSGWQEGAYSGLYLKVPDRALTLILLANSEGLWWGNPLDKAAVEGSALAAAFLRLFADFE